MFYAAQDLRTPAGKDASSPNAPTAPVKKAGIGWEHWTSQIDDHLKPPTAAKRCTFRESRKSPALRAFVAGRWALATTSLYPSTKIERLQRAPNGTPWRRSSSEIGCSRWPGSLSHNCPGQTRPTHGPTLSKYPRQGHLTFLLKPEHRGDTAATAAFLWSSVSHFGVGAGYARKCAGYRLRQARRPACPTRELINASSLGTP